MSSTAKRANQSQPNSSQPAASLSNGAEVTLPSGQPEGVSPAIAESKIVPLDSPPAKLHSKGVPQTTGQASISQPEGSQPESQSKGVQPSGQATAHPVKGSQATESHQAREHQTAEVPARVPSVTAKTTNLAKATKSQPIRVEVPKAETLKAEIAAKNTQNVSPKRAQSTQPSPSKSSQTNPQSTKNQKKQRSETSLSTLSPTPSPTPCRSALPSQTPVAQPQPQPPVAHKPVVRVLHAPVRSRPRSKGWIFAGAIALISGWIVLFHTLMAQITVQTPIQVASSLFNSPQVLQLAKPDLPPKPIPQQEVNEAELTSEPQPEAIATYPPGYGHFLYREASPDELMVIGSYSQEIDQRYERLSHEAGLALMTMLDAARRDGVWLVPISGFRDFARQEMLFQIQIEQTGSPAAAARSVAPAGYSEHHTGYAVDLADGLARAMDLSLAFGNTPAFEWLTRHADEFGFELSFPENNLQGVIYEPWHWRFVGSPAATQTFDQARAIAN